MSHNPNNTKIRIREILNTIGVGVLATTNAKGELYASTIYLIADPDLAVYFLTKKKTTKHTNLQYNPRVALTVYDTNTLTEVQIRGLAKVTTDKQRLNYLLTKTLITNKSVSKSHILPIDLLNAGDYVVYSLQPLTIRLADYGKSYVSKDGLFAILNFPTTDSKNPT